MVDSAKIIKEYAHEYPQQIPNIFYQNLQTYSTKIYTAVWI